MTTRTGRVVLTALAVAAVALIAVELSLGARSYGKPRLADPCTASAGPGGGGIDGAVQRFARATLDGAACKLHTTREELVLSFVPAAGTKRIRWTQQTIDSALRAGLTRAAHTVAGSGIGGTVLGFALSNIFAPTIEWYLKQSQ
jgi:hypothetical protein